MSNRIDTAFDRTFSEPPNVVVAEGRTHCNACHEPLDPNVMHKCHGNKHYEPSDMPGNEERKITFDVPESWANAKVHPDLTNYQGACPECHGKKHEPDVQHEPCALCGGAGVIG